MEKMTKGIGMSHPQITVRARWDETTGTWVATSGDIADLSLSAHSFGELQDRLPGVLRGLFAHRKHSRLTGKGGIPVILRSRQIMMLPA